MRVEYALSVSLPVSLITVKFCLDVEKVRKNERKPSISVFLLIVAINFLFFLAKKKRKKREKKMELYKD
jgi:hypothetical protein